MYAPPLGQPEFKKVLEDFGHRVKKSNCDGNDMGRIVQKFGGTSVADVACIRRVAAHVKREWDAGHDVAVVVSAMAGETNRLVALTAESAVRPDPAEYDDAVLSVSSRPSSMMHVQRCLLTYWEALGLGREEARVFAQETLPLSSSSCCCDEKMEAMRPQRP